MEENKNKSQEANNSAKFAFFYMLSLVALGFLATSAGMVIFQIINKNIPDALQPYQGRFSPEALKFAIAAIIIAAPIYYFTLWQINKNLRDGVLAKESAVRRWLTYFILFVASVTIIGWLIRTIYNFLDGELTTKFILKSATAIFIAAVVFSYYLYDIRRVVAGASDKLIRAYSFGSAMLVIVALVAAFFFTPSPTETRNQKRDQDVLNKFNQIDSAVANFYQEKKKLPPDLKALLGGKYYLTEKELKDAVTGAAFEYRPAKEGNYELCADFLTSNLKDDTNNDDYNQGRWPHQAGRQCLKQTVYFSQQDAGLKTPLPVPLAPRPVD